MNKHARELTERILNEWSSDKRWNDRAYLYTSVGCLKIVGTLAGESTNPNEVVKFLKGLDWTTRGRMGAICGSSWVFQEKMRRFAERTMRRAGKGDYLRPRDPKQVAKSVKGGAARRHG